MQGRRSSAVEHVICNLGVGGPNPSAGSTKEDENSPSFFYLNKLPRIVFFHGSLPKRNNTISAIREIQYNKKNRVTKCISTLRLCTLRLYLLTTLQLPVKDFLKIKIFWISNIFLSCFVVSRCDIL